jgi:thymidine phosphorylase
MIGNWLEVVESVECLQGKDVPDLMEVTYVLGGAMLWLGKKAASIQEGIAKCKVAIASGKAYDKFRELVRRQGGDSSFLDNPKKYPASAYSIEVRSDTSGFVSGFATMEIGLLAIELGAGRLKVDDVIDPKAGMIITKKIGDPVQAGEVLAMIYTDKEIEHAAQQLKALIHISPSKSPPPPTIVAYVDESGRASAAADLLA